MKYLVRKLGQEHDGFEVFEVTRIPCWAARLFGAKPHTAMVLDRPGRHSVFMVKNDLDRYVDTPEDVEEAISCYRFSPVVDPWTPVRALPEARVVRRG